MKTYVLVAGHRFLIPGGNAAIQEAMKKGKESETGLIVIQTEDGELTAPIMSVAVLVKPARQRI